MFSYIIIIIYEVPTDYHSYRWAGVELIARGLTSLFLMVLYLKIHSWALPLLE